MIQFACPNCHQPYSVPDERAGAACTCPSCGGPITIPTPAPAAPQPQSWKAALWANRGWVSRALLVGVLLAVVVTVACRLSANSGLVPVIRAEMQPGRAAAAGGPAKKALVVLVHGYGETGMRACVGEAVQEQRPGDDVLLIRYPAHLFSNADPLAIARSISAEIQRVMDEQPQAYDKVILIGYSLGALLIRKAYLHGSGWRADDEVENQLQPAGWVDRVERIVLLAGMNRGWSIEHPPEHMSWWTLGKWWTGKQLGRWTGTVRLARDCESGSPFVANLRVDWMRHMRRLKEQGRKAPDVIQLLGDRDDIVNVSDSKDVQVSREFMFLAVPNTAHSSVVKFEDPTFGPQRKEKFLQAMNPDPAVIEGLRKATAIALPQQDLSVKRVVFVLHGIRDMGHWATNFQLPLEEAYRATHGKDDRIRVLPVSYGYFGMGPFLLHGDRLRYVRWFMDQYTQALAAYPNADGAIDFVGHSNGTYVLARALKDYRTLRVNRVVFGGSVVPREYDWKGPLGRGQVKRVRNYVGSEDWVVGIFPHLFEEPFFSTVFSANDIGGAGFHGFTQKGDDVQEVSFVEGAHGAALDERNMPSIVDFLMDAPSPRAAAPLVTGQPEWLVNTSNLCWVVWVVILVVLVLIGWGLARVARAARVRAFWPLAAYGLVLWLVLYTV